MSELSRTEQYLSVISGKETVITEPAQSRNEVYLSLIAEKIKSGGFGAGKTVFTLPKVFFSGDMSGISKDNAVNLTIEYKSPELTFSDVCTLKWQGNSSLSYPKKNFTVKLGSKHDVRFGNEKKYCLKANYIDHSHARNIVSARLWGEVVASRADYDELPERLRNAWNNGAIDGFPIKLYLNGVYQGLYTWNIPKDKWMFNMPDNDEIHCVLCGENYDSGCFRALGKMNGSDWSDEIHDTIPKSLKDRFNAAIEFVMNATDIEFKTRLSEYFDVQSLIDYFIFACVSCGMDSMGKNQLYLTYDGMKWMASMYDMDSTWGLYWNGNKFVSAQYRCQEDYETMVNGRKGNLLYMRLQEIYADRIKERWNELKSGPLGISNIISKFEEFTDSINKDLYAEDLTVFTGIPNASANNIRQIRNYAVERIDYVDTIINSLVEKILSEDTLIPDDEEETEEDVNPEENTPTDQNEPTEPGTIVEPDEPSDSEIPPEQENPTEEDTPIDEDDPIEEDTPTEQDGAGETGENDIKPAYSIKNMELNGIDDYLDTGIVLFDEPKDFTIMISATCDSEPVSTSTTPPTLFHCMKEAKPYPGIAFDNGKPSNALTGKGRWAFARTIQDPLPKEMTGNRICVGIKREGNSFFTYVMNSDSQMVSVTDVTEKVNAAAFEQTLLIGAYQTPEGVKGRFMQGTIHQCEIFLEALSDDDIENKMLTM